MRNLGFEEFTNKHGDEVLIQLDQDVAGGFHLIVKAKRLRETEETRAASGKLIKVPVITRTDETEHKRLPTERVAMVEFMMECALNNMPGFDSDAFQAWLRDTTKKEEQ